MTKELIQDAQKKELLEELAKQPMQVIATAYLYAYNYTNYGADVTKEWTTATQQSALLAEAYNKGRYDEMAESKKGHGTCKECKHCQKHYGDGLKTCLCKKHSCNNKKWSVHENFYCANFEKGGESDENT